MAEPFLNPPEGETQLRAPQLLDMLGDVLNSLFGIDPTTDNGRQAVLKVAMVLGPAGVLALGNRMKSLTTRLYRGEGRPDPEGPYWRDPKMNELAGRWFTTDKSTAQVFAGEAASRRLGPGRVVSVDVPDEVFHQGRPANNPDLVPFLYGLEEKGTSVLPREWASKARPVVKGK